MPKDLEAAVLKVINDIPERKHDQMYEIIEHGMKTNEPWEDILMMLTLLTDSFLISAIRGNS